MPSCPNSLTASSDPRVSIPVSETTRYRLAIPNEETTIQMPLADSEQPARRLRQVGWSAGRRSRQEPFDEPSARMKCHWRAFFELSELSAESLRQVARTRKSQEPRKTVVNLLLQWVGSGCPEYAKVNIKWIPECAHSAIPSPESPETSPAELHDRTLPDAQKQVLHRLTQERVITVESHGFVSYAQQALVQPSRRTIPAVAATTRSRQWRHDAGVLGSLPFALC